jgi:hypothetical protein
MNRGISANVAILMSVSWKKNGFVAGFSHAKRYRFQDTKNNSREKCKIQTYARARKYIQLTAIKYIVLVFKLIIAHHHDDLYFRSIEN